MARRTNAIYYPGLAPAGWRPATRRMVLAAGAVPGVQNQRVFAPNPMVGLLMATGSRRGTTAINALPLRTRRLTLG